MRNKSVSVISGSNHGPPGRSRWYLAIIVCSLTLPLISFSCECRAAEYLSQTRLLMTTSVTIIAECVVDDIDAAFLAMEECTQRMNHYNPDSQLARINRLGEACCGSQVIEVLKRANEISMLTGGAFDVTVGPVVALWEQSALTGRLPTEAERENALAGVGYEYVSLEGGVCRLLKPGMSLDLGGIAKGYAVDQAVAVLRARGVDNALVNAGGDIYCLGVGPHGKWRVGVQHPRKLSEIVSVLELADCAVATSGDYYRYFTILGDRVGHIVDPHTGMTVQGSPMSATVVASCATDADALATGIFVLGLRSGVSLLDLTEGVEGMIMNENGEMSSSVGWVNFLAGS